LEDGDYVDVRMDAEDISKPLERLRLDPGQASLHAFEGLGGKTGSGGYMPTPKTQRQPEQLGRRRWFG